MAIQQALQTCGTKTACCITHRFEQCWRQRRQGRVFSRLSPRLSFPGEKDNRLCASIDDFACKISPVFYQCTPLRLIVGVPT